MLKEKTFHRLQFKYDLLIGTMKLFVNGIPAGECRMKHGYNIGLSYVNIQCDAPAASEGVYLRTISKSNL